MLNSFVVIIAKIVTMRVAAIECKRSWFVIQYTRLVNVILSEIITPKIEHTVCALCDPSIAIGTVDKEH